MLSVLWVLSLLSSSCPCTVILPKCFRVLHWIPLLSDPSALFKQNNSSFQYSDFLNVLFSNYIQLFQRLPETSTRMHPTLEGVISTVPYSHVKRPTEESSSSKAQVPKHVHKIPHQWVQALTLMWPNT